jgi:putative protease
MLEDKIIDTRNMVSSRETVDSHPASHAFCKTAVYSSNEDNDEKEIRIRVRTMEQLKAAEQFDFYDLIYIDADLLVYNTDETIDTVKKLYQYKRKIFFALPYIIRKRDAEFLDTLYKLLKEYIHLFAGIMVCSLDSLEFVLEGAFEKDICSDAGFYIWNKSAVSLWENYISSFCMPYELNFTEQKSLLNLMPCEKVIYGMIPMMQTANCVVNTCFGCVGRGVSTAVLTDRYGKKFPVEINCRHCMNIIYNSVPLSLHGDLNKLKKVMNLRLDFTVEDRHTVEIVLKFFEAVFSEGTKQAPPYSDYTTGHEKRGVE